MHWKLLSAVLLLSFIVLFTLGAATAEDTAYVKATFSVDKSTVLVGQSVTFTCTYASSAYPTGTGKISISGPEATDDEDLFLTSTVIQIWNGKTTPPGISAPLLASGVPVTYNVQFNQTGYYLFEWRCNYNGGNIVKDGAFTSLLVHVVDTPTVLPEAPPLAVFALGFAALGLFVVVTKRRTKLT